MNKQEIKRLIVEEINKKISLSEQMVVGLSESLLSDTKSSAGDKYETGREMAQQEFHKYQLQLSQLQQQLHFLEVLPTLERYSKVSTGALVYTASAIFWLAISFGELKIDGKSVWVISPQSPIGESLMGKSVGEHIAFKGQQEEVLKIE